VIINKQEQKERRKVNKDKERGKEKTKLKICGAKRKQNIKNKLINKI
jgi:hypothetical protein